MRKLSRLGTKLYASSAIIVALCTFNAVGEGFSQSGDNTGLAVRSGSVAIGIPDPGFGIEDSPPSSPSPWNGTISGFYYVDNTHPSATDSNNSNGYPAKPRLTIPHTPPLPAGSLVEVHGGPYSYGSGDFIRINAEGTAAAPVFIVGMGMPRFTKPVSVFSSSGFTSCYLILEGLDLFRCEIIAPAHHIALRYSEVRGNATSGGVAIASYSADYTLSDIVIYANAIHDNGDWQADFDQDVHGVAIGARVSHIWILNNEFYHNSGDGVQINAGNLSNQPTTHHIYVGRNLAWENKQTGFWTKQAEDVIFSENTVHSHWPIGDSPSAWGAGMGYQYGPERVWFLSNHIYNCAFGIQANSTSGLGSGQDSYFVGNVIHDIHHHPGYTYNPNTAWSNAALTLVGTPNRWIVNNTIWNVDAGINGPASGMYYLANNIIANVTEPGGNHVFLEDPGASRVLNVLFGTAARIRWGSAQVYSLGQFQGAFPSSTSGCLAGDPLLMDPQAGDFHLQDGSPGIDSGVWTDVYDTFYSLYGLDISMDPDGAVRPGGSAFDIGAYERGYGTGVPGGDGDMDLDGDVDLFDYSLFAPCLLGPRAGIAAGCDLAELDGDADVDLADFAKFQLRIRSQLGPPPGGVE